jgi:glyoxylase-like metal-dependent hydrolase (beta-lactamase superfamily II)
MSTAPDALTYPFDDAPAYGTTKEIAQGIHWLQMPLPMSLNHINLYMLEGDHGWTIVDTGIRGEETRDLWRQIFSEGLRGKPVDQVLCTHMHPDHTGQAGFISAEWRAPLLMSYSEYYQARVMGNMMREGGTWQLSEYFERCGISVDILEGMRNSRSSFTPQPEDHPLPGAFIRLAEGDLLTIGEHRWQVITGNGHSPEHVCLYCAEQKMLISGDQILPVITSNVSVHGTEPYANPLKGWQESHEKFKQLIPDDTLVLPAHNAPFHGVQFRLQELIDHHEDRMLIIEENCIEPTPAIDLLPFLFKRKLENHSKFMALGECVAHLNCLIERERIERTLSGNVFVYRSIATDLATRARPGQHEPPENAPLMV